MWKHRLLRNLLRCRGCSSNDDACRNIMRICSDMVQGARLSCIYHYYEDDGGPLEIRLGPPIVSTGGTIRYLDKDSAQVMKRIIIPCKSSGIVIARPIIRRK